MVCVGGFTSVSTATNIVEKFNGVAFTNYNFINTARGNGGISGNVEECIYASGSTDNSTTYSNATEKLYKGLWTSSGNTISAKKGVGMSGSSNLSVSTGGYSGSYLGVSETYRYEISLPVSGIEFGLWSSTGSLNTSRCGLAGCGTQNAGLAFGGTVTPQNSPTRSSVTEKFSGSTWSNTGNLNTAVFVPAGCGTQNAGLSFGGYSTLESVVTEKFNGSVWTSTGSLNTARGALAGAGTQNAGLSVGGVATGTYLATTEKFNGSTWAVTGGLGTCIVPHSLEVYKFSGVEMVRIFYISCCNAPCR